MLISKQRIKNEIDEKFPFLGNYLRYLSIMYSSDERRESEVHFAYNFINHNSSVIDIGANIGAISRFFARKAKVVYSIEPNPELAKSLSDILPGNCVVLDKALSYASGRSELRVPMNKEGYITHPGGTIELQNTFPGREVKKYEVAVSTLDELVQDYEIDDIDFIKIDVEGHEIDVLNGSRKVIEKHHPVMMIESENRHRENSVMDLLGIMDAYGYSGYIQIDGKLSNIRNYEIRDIQNIDNYYTSKYINNFLFF